MRRAAKSAIGIIIAVAVLLVVSMLIGDDRLAPPGGPELAAIEVPVGEPAPLGSLFFAADDSGSFEIHRRSPDGTETVLTSDPVVDSWRPRVSPDGRTVLFYRSPAGTLDDDPTQASLWMIAAGGGEPIEVLPEGSYGWLAQSGAEWSPDGSGLVMTGRTRDGDRVWITGADGRGARLAASEASDDRDPSWSPDGRRILYTSCPEPGCSSAEREIFTVPVIGGDRTQITADDTADAEPRFSPDGAQIVMLSGTAAASGSETSVIRVVPTSRTRPPVALDTGSLGVGSPVWFDDRRVGFHREDVDGGFDLVVITVATGETEVVRATNADERFAWLVAG